MTSTTANKIPQYESKYPEIPMEVGEILSFGSPGRDVCPVHGVEDIEYEEIQDDKLLWLEYVLSYGIPLSRILLESIVRLIWTLARLLVDLFVRLFIIFVQTGVDTLNDIPTRHPDTNQDIYIENNVKVKKGQKVTIINNVIQS